MNESGLSRRHFIGGSMAAAVGGLLYERELAAQMVAPSVSLPISELRPTGPLDEAYWWKVRGQFNVLDGLTFMNNGTLGPMPRVVYEANDRYIREVSEDPTNGYRNADIDKVREKVADFVGAMADEITLTRSTTEGMNIFAHGLDWNEGDEVLMCSHEHGGGRGPYLTLEKRKGIKIKVIEIPSPPESVEQIVSLYEQAITPQTRVLMVSHATYVTGLIMPIKELSEMVHSKGVLISVDGAHPLGMMDLDFHDMGCDHYAAAGQKWMLCGTGTGVSYIKRDVQERVWPIMGWVDAERAKKIGARKYERFGQRDVPSTLGMGAAVDFQNTIGKANIEARDRELSVRLRKGLEEIQGVKMWTSTDMKLSAGLTLFSVRDIPMANVQKGIMAMDNVYIRTMGTGSLNACRASTHFYNMPGEVDRLLECVRHIASNASKYMEPTTA